MDPLANEIKTVRPVLEVFEGVIGELKIGYQKIGCHVIWDVMITKNFRRKDKFLYGGSTTTTPTSLNSSSFFSRD